MQTIRGFTLIETIAVLGISSVLLALAMSAWQPYVQASRISSAMNLVLGSLQRARAQAITSHHRVVICRSVAPNIDPPACSGAATSGYAGADWAAGWIVFAKAPANDTSTAFEPGDLVIGRQMPLATGRPTDARAVVWSNGSPQSFFFNDVGIMGGTARTFRIDHVADPLAFAGELVSERARGIAISFQGRARVFRKSDPEPD
ncbi:Tfp pilus assembly protein FimT/FimU [soil metagenome]